MFTYKYETRYGDYKNYDEIKTGSVLDMVQDIAIRDSDFCGYGLDKLRGMNMAWLLQGINLEFLKPVKTHITVEVQTGVRRMKGATSERCSILKQDGEIVARTVANWFLFDSERMRIGKITSEMLDAYNCYTFDDCFFEYKKLQLREIEKADYQITVSNTDIDTNMHLNNQKGADILQNALPYDFKYNHVNLLYKKPAYLGDVLWVYKTETENGYYVELRNKENEISVAGEFEMK